MCIAQRADDTSSQYLDISENHEAIAEAVFTHML